MKIGLFLDDYIKDNWEKVIGLLLIIVYELMFLNYILFMCMSWLFAGFFGFGFVFSKGAILPSKCLFQRK